MDTKCMYATPASPTAPWPGPGGGVLRTQPGLGDHDRKMHIAPGCAGSYCVLRKDAAAQFILEVTFHGQGEVRQMTQMCAFDATEISEADKSEAASNTTAFQSSSEHCRAVQSVPGHFRAFQSTPEHFKTFQSISEHFKAVQSIP